MYHRISALAVLVLLGLSTAAPTLKDIFQDEKECGGRPLELMFLLDSSSSIWSVDFQKQLNFVSQVVDVFHVAKNSARIGVASFSDEYHPNFPLDRYDNKDDIVAAVLGITQILGGTYTYDALDRLRTEGFDPEIVRPGVPRVAIVMTDGVSYNTKKTAEAARRLKEAGVFVFAVGIGSADRRELRSIASEPSDKFVYTVRNFDLLELIKSDLAAQACDIKIKDEGKTCGSKNFADVMFLMDPAELGAHNTKLIYNFIGAAVNEFDMESGNIQVGIESKNCGAENILLGEYTIREELVKRLRSSELPGLHHMIRKLHKHAYNVEHGGRIHARHMAVIFVDDALYNAKVVLNEAKLAKNNDVELFVVAIGDSVVPTELETLCSSPVDRHLIRVPSYEELDASLPAFLEGFCHGL